MLYAQERLAQSKRVRNVIELKLRPLLESHPAYSASDQGLPLPDPQKPLFASNTPLASIDGVAFSSFTRDSVFVYCLNHILIDNAVAEIMNSSNLNSDQKDSFARYLVSRQKALSSALRPSYDTSIFEDYVPYVDMTASMRSLTTGEKLLTRVVTDIANYFYTLGSSSSSLQDDTLAQVHDGVMREIFGIDTAITSVIWKAVRQIVTFAIDGGTPIGPDEAVVIIESNAAPCIQLAEHLGVSRNELTFLD